jgi:hypothetical protein
MMKTRREHRAQDRLGDPISPNCASRVRSFTTALVKSLRVEREASAAVRSARADLEQLVGELEPLPEAAKSVVAQRLSEATKQRKTPKVPNGVCSALVAP